MVTPNLGFTPRTREELIIQAWKTWRDVSGSKDTLEVFTGTTIHRFSNIIYDQIEALESLVLELLTRQYDFWVSQHMEITGSFGSSYEGWLNRFVATGLCRGLDIITSDNPRAGEAWKGKDSLVPGQIVLYFDELDDADTSPNSPTHQAFLQSKNIAEPTPYGEKTIRLYYSNGRFSDYKYFNLKEEDYVPVDLEIQLVYESSGMIFPEPKITALVHERFNQKNMINRPFFVNTLLCSSDFEGLKSVKIKTKIKDEKSRVGGSDTGFIEGDRRISLGNKFVINNITIKQEIDKIEV